MMDVHGNLSLDGNSLLALHRADMIQVLASEVLVHGLDEQPPLGLALKSLIAKFYSNSHLSFFFSKFVMSDAILEH